MRRIIGTNLPLPPLRRTNTARPRLRTALRCAARGWVAVAFGVLAAAAPGSELDVGAVVDCPPGEDDSPRCIEQRENLAESRLEDMLDEPAPALDAVDGSVSGEPEIDDVDPAPEQLGRYPQLRVPLDELDEEEIDIDVRPNPPPLEENAPPPPYDAGERGLDPLIE